MGIERSLQSPGNDMAHCGIPQGHYLQIGLDIHAFRAYTWVYEQSPAVIQQAGDGKYRGGVTLLAGWSLVRMPLGHVDSGSVSA